MPPTRHLRTAALLAGLALSTAACSSPYSPGQRAVGGALIGGAGGAAIGGLAGGGEGALIGAGLGAAAGAITGAATTPALPRRRGWYRY